MGERANLTLATNFVNIDSDINFTHGTHANYFLIISNARSRVDLEVKNKSLSEGLVMKKVTLCPQNSLICHQIVSFPLRKNQSQKLKLNFHKLWSNLVNYLSRPPEPKVKKKTNSRGEIWWEVYDPYTNLSASFASELEVRIWLDERYRG